jgi:hypothetical protein
MKKLFFWVKGNKILVVILILATLIRLLAVKPGFHVFHNDEGNDYSGSIAMLVNKSLDPGRYGYPALIPAMDALLFVVLFVPLYILNYLIFKEGSLPVGSKNLYDFFKLIVSRNDQTNVIFWARFITVTFGVGVVFLSYKLSLKLFKNRYIALISSFLVAFNYRLVLNSHFAFPDMYNAFFVLLCLYLILRLLEKQNIKNYIYSGLGVALYFCIKFHIYGIFPFIFTHLYITYSKYGKSCWKYLISKKFLIGLIVIPIIILLINPYCLIQQEKFLDAIQIISLKYGYGIKRLNIYILSYLYQVGIGKLLSISVLLGLIISLKKYLFGTLFLLSLLLPFFYVFSYLSNGGYFPRNFITVIPILLFFAAIFIYELSNFILKMMKISSKFRTPIVIIIVLLFSFGPIKNSVISTFFYTKPWNYLRARNWVAVNVPQGSIVLTNQSDMTALRWKDIPNKNFDFVLSSSLKNISEMQEAGIEYTFINLDLISGEGAGWMNSMNKDPKIFLNKNKVNAILTNSILGVSIKELSSWSVASFVKPWQAPEMNIMLIKIPKEPQATKAEMIFSANFNSVEELNRWSLIDGDITSHGLIKYSPNIGRDSGSLQISGGRRRVGVIKAMSPLIQIKENHAYIIEGWVKLEKALEKEQRDGVLRADFFNSQPKKIDLFTRSDYQAISSRVYGNENWILKKMVVVPPVGSLYLSVGFQANEGMGYWLDDVKVFESKEEYKDPRTQSPYINYSIPDDVLFPYTAEF